MLADGAFFVAFVFILFKQIHKYTLDSRIIT
jgi:hypothetical protein